jgi:hypothetical protein
MREFKSSITGEDREELPKADPERINTSFDSS